MECKNGFPGRVCPWCKGTGTHIEEVIDGQVVSSWDCWLCRGTGRVNLWRWLRLKLEILAVVHYWLFIRPKETDFGFKD